MPVIVTLKSAWRPEGTFNAPSEAAVQRANIVSAQSEFLERLEHAVGVAAEGIHRYEFTPDMAMRLNLQQLLAVATMPEVAYIEFDFVQSPAVGDSVPLVRATAAHGNGYNGAGQTVVLLETGVDGTHPDLSGKVVYEACFSNAVSTSNRFCPGGAIESYGSGGGACTTASNCEHGTISAGIIAANGSITGVAPGASLISMQVFHRVGGAAKTQYSDWKKGLDHTYSIRNSYNISSVLLASTNHIMYSSACDSLVPGATNAINNLASVGIPTIIASGNDGFTGGISFPACISSAVSVGASTKSDGIWPDSNRGSNLDLLAPGENIFSTGPGGAYYIASGTSFAAPHVAGAWAILRQVGTPFILQGLKSAGVIIGSWPRIDVMLSFAPSDIGFTPWYCYGYHTVYWGTHPDSITNYEMQMGDSSTFDNAWTAYSGTATSYDVSVGGPTWFRVRGCTSGRCGPYTQTHSSAVDYGYCM